MNYEDCAVTLDKTRVAQSSPPLIYEKNVGHKYNVRTVVYETMSTY